MANNKFSVPTIYIAFGITGDLFKRKILGSIYDLYLSNQLPNKFIVYGFGRREWKSNDLREYLKAIMISQKFNNSTEYEKFLKRFFFFKGNFDDLDSFKTLEQAVGLVDNKWQFCSNKLFHLAVPPNYYSTLINNLKTSGLTKPCSDDQGWTRVMIEKPFGKDLKTAQKLETTISKYFKEEQIYRIDHYLGKEELQNILFFRFSNNLFENSFTNKFIEQININVLEKNTVDMRGNFYDGVGELRDMGQSHLLQMLALVTMTNPGSLEGPKVRTNRLQALKNLPQLSKQQISKNTYRAQYKEFTKTKGIDKNSKTETYFNIKFTIKKGDFAGIPVQLKSGKAVTAKDINNIEIIFKHPHPCFCPPNSNHGFKNKVIFELKPNYVIKLVTWYKKPGLEFGIQQKVIEIPLKGPNGVDAYQKLIYDCIKGDQTLFVSSNEVQAMWKFVDPILRAWERGVVPLHKYKKGTLPN